MRVLLIEPPYERFAGFRCEWFPQGLASIAACARKQGHELRIYHCEHAARTAYTSVVKFAERFNRYKQAVESTAHPVWDEVAGEIRAFAPDVVGISVLTCKLPSAKKVAAIAKSVDPSIVVVAGGHHATLLPEQLLADRNIDYCVRGEGEESFNALLQSLGKGGEGRRDIAGISFRENGAVVHNRPRALISELDTLPLPARDALANAQTYAPTQLNMVMGSRGCPYRCGFCSSQNMWTRRVRYRSVASVIEEIKYIRYAHNVDNVTFMDDSFTVHPGRVRELCAALIDEKLGITWSCLTRVDMVNDEIIALMKKAGCTKIDIGVESGNQRVLELIRKDITLERVREAVLTLRRQKMFWSGFFMFGFPTETEEEVNDTLNFMKELRPDWANISIFTPYPGTELFELARQRGMIPESPDYTAYSHQNISGRSTDAISRERFAQLARRMFAEVHAYNSSYRSLFKRALTRGYLKHPGLFIHDVRKVFSWLKK